MPFVRQRQRACGILIVSRSLAGSFVHFQFRKEILMTASTTAVTSSAGVKSSSAYNTPAFWDRLWRTAGIQSVLCFMVAYIVYGQQPQVGTSADALAAFYDGNRMRILIAAVFYGFGVLHSLWFWAA